MSGTHYFVLAPSTADIVQEKVPALIASCKICPTLEQAKRKFEDQVADLNSELAALQSRFDSLQVSLQIAERKAKKAEDELFQARFDKFSISQSTQSNKINSYRDYLTIINFPFVFRTGTTD